ncbi:hypothetical protein D3C84_1288250 [compost metagenome]
MRAKLMFIAPAAHLVVAPLLDTSAYILGHRRYQPQRLAQHVVALLQVEVATPDEVQGNLLKGLTA